MDRWFTSDQHFDHANIIKYCNRPFRDADDMNREMVLRWNSVVKPAHTVYQLGDFMLSSDSKKYFEQLNGKIIVIPGGHDKRWLKHEIPDNVVIEAPIVHLRIDGNIFVLCHYPMRSWEKSHYGSIHLHGHCHGTIGKIGKSSDTQLPPGQKNGTRIDVSVDCWDFFPVHIKTILAVCSNL